MDRPWDTFFFFLTMGHLRNTNLILDNHGRWCRDQLLLARYLRASRRSRTNPVPTFWPLLRLQTLPVKRSSDSILAGYLEAKTARWCCPLKVSDRWCRHSPTTLHQLTCGFSNTIIITVHIRSFEDADS